MKLVADASPTRILPWKLAAILSMLMLLVLPDDFAFAATKCLVNGKTLYTDGECPAGAKQDRMKSGSSAGDNSALPVIQNGQWEIKEIGQEGVGDSTICGNPLKKMNDDLFASRARGCTVQITNPSANMTSMVQNCPAQKGGSAYNQETNLVINFFRRSSRSLTFDFKKSDGNSGKGEMNRIGEC